MTALAPAAPSTIERIRARMGVPVRRPVGLIGLGLVWALIAWLRLTPVGRDTIWAEDGHQFLEQAIRFGPIPAIGMPYEGYMHLLPHTIAGIASVFPITWWAQIITIECCLIAGAVSVLVYVVSAQFPLAPWARLLLASVTVLTPTLVEEVLGNGANMYTFALWGGFWLFIARPRTWRWAIVAGVIAFVFAGTAVQLGGLLPLFLLRRNRRVLPILGGYVLGLVVQLYGYTHSVRGSKPSWPVAGTTLDGYIHEVVLGSWVEAAHVGSVLIVRFGWIFACALLIPYAIAVFQLVRRTDIDRFWARSLGIALPVASVGFWFASIDLNSQAFDYVNLSPEQMVSQIFTIRYAVLPAMLLWALLIVAVGWQRSEAQSRTRFWRVARVVVPVLIVASSLVNFIGLGTTSRSRGPEWTTSISQGERECEGRASTHVVDLPTAPGGPWNVPVTCGFLTSETHR
jgi:hypothetical protein